MRNPKNFQALLTLLAISSGLIIGPRSATAQTVRQNIEARREARKEKRDGQQPEATAPGITTVTLQTQAGAGGQQMVITPKGLVVPLPGPGVDGPVVCIYMAPNGGYWYVDKNKQQVDLTPAVHQLQQQMAMTAAQAAAPQYVTPPQYAPAYNAQYIQPAQAYEPQAAPQQQQAAAPSGAATAAAAGLGAMGGAMAGAAIASANNDPYHMPYGTPVHYGVGGSPYYNQGGKPIYVNNSKTINAAQVNQNEANVYKANAYHDNNVQEQQNWYKAQEAQKSGAWKGWQGQSASANPFVRSEGEGARFGANSAAEKYEHSSPAKQEGDRARLNVDRARFRR